MSKFLDSFEAQLRGLLEGTVERLFPAQAIDSLTHEIIEKVEASISQQKQAGKELPDLFHLFVSPEKKEAWLELGPILNQIGTKIMHSYRSEGYEVNQPVRFRVIPDDKLAIDEIRIEAVQRMEDGITTATVIHLEAEENSENRIPTEAVLILNSTICYPLKEAIVSIGRHSTNDFVIPDPHVSRKHLQLRAENGSYYLFDLSSTGGTTINKKPVNSAKLKAGDVIRIGNSTLVYSQEQNKAVTGTKVVTKFKADPK